jgi:hypothetical protein
MQGRPGGCVSRFSKTAVIGGIERPKGHLWLISFLSESIPSGNGNWGWRGYLHKRDDGNMLEQRGSGFIVYPSQLFCLVACENAGTPGRKQRRLCTVELLLPGFSGIPHRSLAESNDLIR